MDEYNKIYVLFIIDYFIVKEIWLVKDFMIFMGFEDIVFNFGGYVGVGVGRWFFILFNYFWGDGFRDLLFYFKVFCLEEFDKMVSIWDEV